MSNQRQRLKDFFYKWLRLLFSHILRNHRVFPYKTAGSFRIFADIFDKPAQCCGKMRKYHLFSVTIAVMLKKERQAFILRQVHLHNKVLSTDLCEKMQVSDDTVRRDLTELALEGKIIKVHGGALSRSFYSGQTTEEETYSYRQKKSIAAKAVTLIQNGMFVLTGGGTTIVEMVHALPPDLKATFISGSIPVIAEYAKHPQCDVIVIGDKLSKNSQFTTGANAIQQIEGLNPDLCILGVNGISSAHGITDSDWEVAQVKRAMIRVAKKVVCLTISEKLGSVQPVPVCPIGRIDVLITELDPDADALRPFADAGINIL